MITFTLALPGLSSEQQFQLEEALLKVPKVDAFASGDGTGGYEVTVEKTSLRDMVAVLYGWGSEHPPVLLHSQVVCGENTLVLGRNSPNQIIHFLSVYGQ